LTENGTSIDCEIHTEASAELTLNANQSIVAAYLYWAGSGTGDFEIKLNGQAISAERSFNDSLDENRVFFAGFADVTSQLQMTGSGLYTVSDLDLSDVIATYCSSGTNFAGWAIAVIYEEDSLPLNQLNVYDGLQSVPENLTITLNNLNVLDNQGAKIGFIAWEGDAALAVNEQLSINGNAISNPPLNPVNNAFNGTNSFTGATNLYNMDIDVYDIQNNIDVGDSAATISLTSGQDFVMINNIITVLNSQTPDASIRLNDNAIACGDSNILLNYTVYNTNSTDPLPGQTPIAFYVDGVLVGQTTTQNEIAINASETGSIDIMIPETDATSIEITAVVDDDGTGNGIVTENNENNNSNTQVLELLILSPVIPIAGALACNEGLGTGTFDLEAILNAQVNTILNITFYESLEDLAADTFEITNPSAYTSNSDMQMVYAKVANLPCYERYAFALTVENCPPFVPQGFSPNEDGANDWFNIQGLYDIFERHELKIYNRYGTLIFEGDNSLRWEGRINRGLNNHGNLVPVGTYFYILNLNDPNYKPIQGWVYVNY
jgi:gliding motility-associated-like protein